ncbi:hypothetical protein NITLEN_10220 [Nitrospira lenta]|uniref:Uncharacterized protein n=1 Tax=Nitrospira lenta TaxID=1436998 RepID=A0A330L0F9_9BACT|nr:hypothetical protein NITLEN_10220 [Nitrospira lenta]
MKRSGRSSNTSGVLPESMVMGRWDRAKGWDPVEEWADVAAKPVIDRPDAINQAVDRIEHLSQNPVSCGTPR